MSDFVTPVVNGSRFILVCMIVVVAFVLSKIFGYKLEGGALGAVLVAAILASFVIITPPFSATERNTGSEVPSQPGYSGGSLHLQ